MNSLEHCEQIPPFNLDGKKYMYMYLQNIYIRNEDDLTKLSYDCGRKKFDFLSHFEEHNLCFMSMSH